MSKRCSLFKIQTLNIFDWFYIDADDMLLLVVGGRLVTNVYHVYYLGAEFFELVKPSLTEDYGCDIQESSLSQVLDDVVGVTVALQNGTLPIHCGSWLCHSLTNGTLNLIVNSQGVTQRFPGAMVVALNSEVALIAGGLSFDGKPVPGTEIVSVTEPEVVEVDPGPDLPTLAKLACMVKLNDTLVIAVPASIESMMFAYDIQKISWNLVPSKTMNLSGCDVIRDDQAKHFLVFIGKNGGTTLLNFPSNNWYTGPDLPRQYTDGVIACSKPDKSGLLLLPWKEHNNVLEMRCQREGLCYWIKHEARLQAQQQSAFFLPGLFLGCKGI